MINSFTSEKQKDNMSNLVEAYARTLTQLTHDVELVYPYAGESLNQHIALLRLIMAAALSEFAKIEDVSPVSIDTMNTLLPKSEQGLQSPGLSQSGLINTLAEKVGKFKELLEKVEANPKAMTELGMQIKNEMDKCRICMVQIKASPEWEGVKHLVSLKLLSDVLEHGVELEAKHASKPR